MTTETENARKLALVTGADGFIGSHLTEMLLQRGWKVRALCQYNSFNYYGNLEGVSHPGLEIVSGDVRDPDFCLRLTEGIDTIFHLAALIAIPYSYIAPSSYIDTNVKGTLNICEGALRNKVRRILVTSTSEVYGTALTIPISESHPRQPQSPYSASKIGADALAMSFYNSFDLPLTIVRPFNTYGPRQSARAFIPTVITQIASGMKTIRVGDLTPTRDFNYVSDTVEGFIALATCMDAIGKEVNIATGRDVSMEHTLRLILDLMHADVKVEVDPARLRPGKSEVMRLCGDSTLIRSLTSWQPRISLETGLKKTIDWFTDSDNIDRYKPSIYNL